MPATSRIPQVDVFAGPGGLCEGFAAYRHNGERVMSPALSIEMDPAAHRTLKLRAFFRAFSDGKVPQDYYDFLSCRLNLDELYGRHSIHAEQADREAWCAQLGKNSIKEVRDRIDNALGGKDADPWVLLGGPPCQPFSLAGRSRNRPGTNTKYSDGKDTRHELYTEYLQIIADFWPAVFVMENVRGMLSAKYNGEPMFERICDDLRDPAAVVGNKRRRTGRRHSYTLHAIGPSDALFDDTPRPGDYIIQCERHGIPQARHRLILIGVRNDLDTTPGRLAVQDEVPSCRVLDKLPRLRSGLTPGRNDSPDAWENHILKALDAPWLARLERTDLDTADAIKGVIYGLTQPIDDRGGMFIKKAAKPDYNPDWYTDPNLPGVCNHEARGHMPSDLYRYLFAACFAKTHGRSPKLGDFPAALLPDHRNADDPAKHQKFLDRFRVQLRDRPSTTVVSHIAKDGHYYIHPDPTQCRALTVREAARLQTFPDNYRFVGNRTQQYHQVGNAVPPLLAYQIAGIVHDLLIRAGMA